jgi:hypothetical protein
MGTAWDNEEESGVHWTPRGEALATLAMAFALVIVGWGLLWMVAG